MIKLICSDVDGTLLNKDREVDPFTRQVVASLENKIPFILASSRMPKALYHIQRDLGIEGAPLICYNGGLILSGGNKFFESNIIASFTIPADLVSGLIKLAGTYRLHTSIYFNDFWIATAMDSWAEREINNTKAYPDMVLETFDNNQIQQAHKVMIMGDAGKITEIENQIKVNPNISVCRSKETYLEITPADTNKGIALQSLLAKMTGWEFIKRDHIVAFGDNYNDYELLKFAKYGVAVENAVPLLKEIAFATAKSNKEHGVAHYLRELFSTA